MTKKIIALDLDGTLLNTDKTISQENKSAITRAREAGHHVVITTGRPLKAIEHILDELNLHGADEYSITFNGGLVQNNAGEIFSKSSFDYSDIVRLAKVAKSFDLPFSILSDHTVYELDPRSWYRETSPFLDFEDVTLEQIADLPVYNKAVSAFTPEKIDAALGAFPKEVFEDFEIFKSRDMLLEWMPKGVVKSTGLAQLADLLGVAQDDVIAVGDEANDASMIAWAGVGVAMGNAVAEIKAMADVVAPRTNDQAAIAWVIDHLVFGNEEH
jgi:Cof subfamily protein (haloacid dehalogenase superfamily)